MMRDLNTQVPKGRWVVIDQCRSLAPLSSFGRGRAAGVQASKCLDVQFEIHLCTTSASDLRLHIDLLPTDLFGVSSQKQYSVYPVSHREMDGLFRGGRHPACPALAEPEIEKAKKKRRQHTHLSGQQAVISMRIRTATALRNLG